MCAPNARVSNCKQTTLTSFYPPSLLHFFVTRGAVQLLELDGLGTSSPCGGDITIPSVTDSFVRFTPCANRLDYSLQVSMSNNNANSLWTIYVAWGDNCVPGNTNFFAQAGTDATAGNPNPFVLGFCVAQLCCAAFRCRAPPCASATISVDYTIGTGTCDENNQQITGFSPNSGLDLGLSCINVANNYAISFTLTNPFQERLSAFTASGPQNCGQDFNLDAVTNGGALPTGFTPSSSVINSRSTSIQITATCTDEPCCAIIW